MKNLILFLVPILLFAGCKKESCLGESGAITTVTRAAAAFHEIDVYDNIEVILTQDSVESITVEAPQHLEPNITTHIENGILVLKK